MKKIISIFKITLLFFYAVFLITSCKMERGIMDYRQEISLFCKKLNYVTTPDLWITDFKLNGNEEIVMPSSIESSFSREFKEGSNFFSYTIKEKTTPAKNYSGDMSFDDLLKDQTNTVEIVVDEITGWRILVNGNWVQATPF